MAQGKKEEAESLKDKVNKGSERLSRIRNS